MKCLLSLALLLMAGATGAAAGEHPGQAAFQRCVSCHLPDGQGIPGAFPPLKGHVARIAALAEGREYLIAVLSVGLIGPLEAAGISYNGVMPAPDLGDDPAAMAGLLNYLVQVIDAAPGHDSEMPLTAKPAAREPFTTKPFTPREVQAFLDAGQIADFHDSARLRRKLGDQYPHLFQALP